MVVIFFVFLELGFFCEKQFLDPPSRGRIGRGFQQFTIVRDVLPCDKSIHVTSRDFGLPAFVFELSQNDSAILYYPACRGKETLRAAVHRG